MHRADRHAKMRAEERFGFRPTRRQLRSAAKRIRRNESRKLRDLERGRELHWIRVGPAEMHAVYDPDIKRILTVW